MSENSLRSVLEDVTRRLGPGHWATQRISAALAATQEPQPPQTDGIEGMLTASIVLAEAGEIPAKVTIQRWRAALFAAAGAPAASGREAAFEEAAKLVIAKAATQYGNLSVNQVQEVVQEIRARATIEAAAPRPELAPAPRFKHKPDCKWATPLPTEGFWGCDCGLDNLLIALEDYEREAPPDLAALREALDRLEVDANRPTKNTELKTVRHGMKLAANRLREALAQLKVQR